MSPHTTLASILTHNESHYDEWGKKKELLCESESVREQQRV